MEPKKHIVVIGGSAAGPKAAAKARRMDQHAEITLIQRTPELSMASCGYPYYIGRQFDDRSQLLCTPTGVVRDPKFYMNVKGIRALTATEAERIDRDAHTVTCRNIRTGEPQTIPYDKLVIATGASAIMPPVPGVNLEGVATLQSMRDADYLRKRIDAADAQRAVIVGGGLIGIESCEALHLGGLRVTVVEMLPQLLSFLDGEMAKLVENHITSKGGRVIIEEAVTEFLGRHGHLVGVKLRSGTELPCELAVVAVGVRPNVQLAADAGLAIGERGGIRVNEYLQTSDSDIYAAGDCVEIKNLITGGSVLAPYGDLANLQGRVVGQNLVAGNSETFPGTIQTGICKVFDYAVGSTGLSEANARKAGFENIATVVTAGPDKPHYMGANPLVIKMVAEATTGRILGVQCVGTGDVSKRVAAAAMAILGKLTVADLLNADLPYAPPFSPPLDNIIVAAHCLQNKMRGRLKGISSIELKKRLDAHEKVFLLDVRGPDEYEKTRLGLGETLIPLGMLRKKLAELPQEKDREIVCYCQISLRGYEAATFLEAHGWSNVTVLEGGIAAWPFPREK